MKPAPMADDALTRKEAEMGRLTDAWFQMTAEQKEAWIEDACERLIGLHLGYSRTRCETMRDLALRALSLESVREEAKLDAPAQIGATRFHAGVKWSTVIDRAQREWRYRNAPDPALTQMKDALAKAENQFDAVLQSPARVAEGGMFGELGRAVSYIEDILLIPTDALRSEAIQFVSDMRVKYNQPVELLPESPAKEQPGEQNVGVLHDWHERADDPGTYDCEACGSWTANLPLYKDEVCDAKERRFSERRKPPPPERP